MYIGLYAYQTFGKKNTNANKGIHKILTNELKNSSNKTINLDMLVSSEYTNISVDEIKSLSKLKKDLLLIPGTSFILGEKENNKYITHNRAHVALNGEIIFEYDKKNLCARKDYGEDDHFNYDVKKKFFKGEKTGIFDLNFKNIKTCGIEICRDNEYKSLYDDGIKKVDLQVVLSCGCASKPYAVSKNGYLLSVNGDKNPTAKIMNPYSKIKPIATFDILSDKENKNDILYVYKI
ncbi:MAG: hypothetical protein ACLFPJ_03780 [Candidatus Woesearchaeota archaeon]